MDEMRGHCFSVPSGRTYWWARTSGKILTRAVAPNVQVLRLLYRYKKGIVLFMPPHIRTWKSSQKTRSRTGNTSRRSPFRTRQIGTINFHQPKKKQRSFFRSIISFGLYCAIAGVIFFALAFFYYGRDLPSLDQIKTGTASIPESTKIYDRTGTHLLYTIHGEENRTTIPLSKIPDNVKWATISTEDQDFYTRPLAIDIKGFARAIFGIFKNRSLTSGPGGSTITQQLVKNLILTRERSLSRKIKEIILSFRIEKAFNRDEILALYLNQIPYGSNAYGIEQAAKTFFGKPANELSLAESATIAALPKATTYYSPFGTRTDELFKRQQIILKQMLNEGYISEDEWKKAGIQKVEFSVGAENIEAPHFVIYVREILARRYGENELEQGGLTVITSLDYDLQKIAEKVVKKGADANDKLGADNAGLVAIDPRDGSILAMAGSRDYFDVKHNGNFNVALALRQPGSSFKPIVYASLFSKGYTPNTILYDVTTDFASKDGEEYIPKNFDGTERGPVTIRKALAGSLNIPAVKALYLANIYTVLDYAAELGYTTLNEPNRFGLSLALGGGDVKLLEHVGAFATLANDGVRNELAPILKVTKPDGSVLEEHKEISGIRVFSENVARMITDILSDNEARSYVFGENNFLTLGNIPVAAKTGTTNDSRDAWTVGYTPALAAGVWVGRNDSAPMKNAGGVRAAGPIWNEFMREALKGKAVIQFISPEIPITGKPILDGDVQGIVKVKIDKISGKLATQYTPQENIEEQAFANFHSILHYIDKDNPLGPAPIDPSRDPQYKNWEEGVRKWVETSGEAASFKKPPVDFDDVHTPENLPKLRIISPAENQVITDNSFMIDIDVFATRRIAKVEYYIDDEFRESAGLNPYSRRIYFGNIGDGAHTISVIASDDANNHTKISIPIILQRGIADSPVPSPQKPSVSFTYPENQAIISRAAFPLTLRLFIQKPEFVNRLNVYYNDKNSNPIIIASQTAPLTETASLIWSDIPPSGAYPVYAIIIDKNGESYRSEIMVSVN